MRNPEPDSDEIEHDIAELLRTEEVGALATISATGGPSVAMMHIAAAGLTVYVHTFTRTRTYAALRRDPRVSYTVARLPPGGFHGRAALRAVQMTATRRRSSPIRPVERAIDVSHEQFEWLTDSHLYDNFARKSERQGRIFVRLHPREALWTDHRVRMLWRKLVTFTPNGQHIERLRNYD